RMAAQRRRQQRQRGVAECVGRMQRQRGPSVKALLRTPRPELIEARNGKFLGGLIPQAEMQLPRDGNLGIVDIADTPPAGLADERWQMIGGKLLSAPDGFVTKTGQ